MGSIDREHELCARARYAVKYKTPFSPKKESYGNRQMKPGVVSGKQLNRKNNWDFEGGKTKVGRHDRHLQSPLDFVTGNMIFQYVIQ